MRILFDDFKSILKQAVGFKPFLAANSVVADATTQATLQARVDALQDDVVVSLDHDDVMVDGIVGTRFSVNHLAREVDVASGALGIEERVIFNACAALPPLQISGWILSPDSTLLDTAVEVHYRVASLDPWHRLDPVDDFRVPGGTIQFSCFLPTMLGAPAHLKRLLILAKQY